MEFDPEVGEEICHPILDMEVTIVRIDVNKYWYREKQSGGISNIDADRIIEWVYP